MATLVDKARVFRSLHVPGTPLVLPHVWDVATARIVEQAERIAAARAAADAAGVPLFINARIDTHRLPTSDPAARLTETWLTETWLAETLERADAYTAVGADGVFVLGVLTARPSRRRSTRCPSR